MPKFSDKYIKNLKPVATVKFIMENAGDMSKGFGIKVTPSGMRTWVYVYKELGRRRVNTLGHYPSMGLAMAREQYLEKRADRENASTSPSQVNGTLSQMIEVYIDDLKRRGKQHYEIETAFNNHVLKYIDGDKLVREISVHELKLILHNKLKNGASRSANKLWSFMSTAFTKAIHYDNDPLNLKSDIHFGLQMNPMMNIPKAAGGNNVGTRWLKQDELAYVWRHFKGAYGYALKLMVTLGGQRPIDVLTTTWDVYDIEKGVLDPSRNSKNTSQNVLPLTGVTLGILDRLRDWTGDDEYLFPRCKGGRQQGPTSVDHMSLSGFAKATKRFCDDHDFDPFTPRDIRRTCKTLMGEAGITKMMRDRLQNHALQDVSSRHYDRYEYMPEKREALIIWEGYLNDTLKSHQS